MSDRVKTPRRYDSRRRRAQAARTREDVLAAAHDAFVERGYARATLVSIAQEAGVVVETIYRGFGSKARLFNAVVEAAVAGGAARARVPVEDRPAIRAIAQERDPRNQLERYAATQPGIHSRMSPLMHVLTEAAAADPQLAEVRREMEDGRLEGLGRFAQLLADRAVLRAGLTAEDARDILWTLASHDVYDRLVTERHWPAERYEAWLADTLVHSLLAGSA